MSIKSLVLVRLPDKLDYFTGEKDLNLAGGEVCAIQEDGTFKVLPMDAETMPVQFDSSAEGPALVTLKYEDQELIFQIYIREPVIKKFFVKTPPAKREYLEGEKLSLEGLELEALYETGERMPWNDIPEVEHVVEQGEAVFPLVIKGITVPIYIKVSPSKLISIRMGSLPKKVEYLERKEHLDLTGGTIFKVYDSGQTKEVPIPPESVRGFSNLQPGEKEIIVQIGALQTSFKVFVREKAATQLVVEAEPVKLSYIEGQLIELDGLKVTVRYDNGESHILEKFDYEPKTATLSTPTIQLMFQNVSTEIAIAVVPRQLTGIEIATPPVKTKYLERKEELDLSGATLTLNYNYGESRTIPVEQSMIHGYDNRTPGEVSVEVQFEGFYTFFRVEVIPAQLMGILISRPPEKTDYAPGEKFDRAGLLVLGFYSNGQMQPIHSYLITPQRPLKESDVAVIVTSMDKSAVIPIRVAEMFRTVTEPEPAPQTIYSQTDEISFLDKTE